MAEKTDVPCWPERRSAANVYGKYSLEITQDAGAFHWLITRTQTLDLILVGEQKTYQAALDEAEGSIRAMQSDDAAGELQRHAAGA